MDSVWHWIAAQPSGAWENERFAITVVLFLIFVRSFGRWFSKGQIRRVKWLAWPRRAGRWRRSRSRVQLPCWKCRRTVYRDLRRTLTLVQDGASPLPVRVAQHMCRPCTKCDPGPGVLPFMTGRYRFAIEVLGQALEPRSSTLMGRYVLPDRTNQNREYLTVLRSYLQRFEGLEPVGVPTTLQTRDVLARVVSAITGAVVLADVSGARSRCFDKVVAWHRGDWRGRVQRAGRGCEFEDDLLRSAYDCNAVRTNEGLLAVGDYNGRVPTLAYVDARQHPGAEGATLLLLTDETDYASTEPAPEAGPGPETNCKKLASSRARNGAARFAMLPERTAAGGSFQPVGASLAGGTRAPLINGKICLVSDTEEGRSFVLMQRSKGTSNGAGVLGPTAGGVLELGVAGERRDSDDYGAIDAMAGISRELSEELGLQPDDYVLEASCVFLSNTAPRPVAASGASPSKGEVLCTMLATGRTALGRDGFLRRQYRASPSKGRYESDGLLFVPMGDSAGDFAAALSARSFSRDSSAVGVCLGEPAPEASRIIDFLDQAALVGAIYASSMIYGVRDTIDAFTTEFGEQPWWSAPWPDNTPRIVHDPAELVANPDGSSSPMSGWIADVYQGADHFACIERSGLSDTPGHPRS